MVDQSRHLGIDFNCNSRPPTATLPSGTRLQLQLNGPRAPQPQIRGPDCNCNYNPSSDILLLPASADPFRIFTVGLVEDAVQHGTPLDHSDVFEQALIHGLLHN